MRILPLSTLDDNRTILQEVMRIRKYLELNPIRNIFYIDTNYINDETSYQVADLYVNSDIGVIPSPDDIIIFKNV